MMLGNTSTIDQVIALVSHISIFKNKTKYNRNEYNPDILGVFQYVEKHSLKQSRADSKDSNLPTQEFHQE
jgi:hypothetical protein